MLLNKGASQHNTSSAPALNPLSHSETPKPMFAKSTLSHQSLYTCAFKCPIYRVFLPTGALFHVPDRSIDIMKNIFLVILVIGLAACSQQKFGLSESDQTFSGSGSYNTQVDLLIVVDTSGSMAVHQDMLAEQMPSLVSALSQTGLDYQVAVTTMDMSSSGARGRFVTTGGGPAVLHYTMSGLGNMLAQRIRLGQTGSPVERGLEAMKESLSNPSYINGSNRGFLRTNSLLSVVFLSNEDDEASPSMNYATWLNQLRPPTQAGEQSWIANFFGVLNSDAACQTSQWGYTDPGLAYINLVNQSGGIKETICQANLSRAASNLHARLLELVTEYHLPTLPQVNTIVVTINGVPVPKSEINGWSYLADRNTVRFHGTAIPKPNVNVKVNYLPQGLS